jgi:predicted AlkP superfamily phosphohydrolase/phosphomutase
VSRSDRRPVVAVGIDAAEPALVRALMARGELPCLRALLERGAWGRVTSPADIGSGAVWPTFMTGSDPLHHGICYDWPWDPDGMRIAHLTTSHLTPFWKTLALEGYTVGVLDVPFAPIAGLPTGIEISEWGSHDWLLGRLTVSPASRTGWVRTHGGVHPFATSSVDDTSGPGDARGLRRMAAACLAGVQARGTLAVRLLAEMKLDLLLVVFPEIHKSSHVLWHTVDPARPAHEAMPLDGDKLVEIFREMDRQIGRLAEAAGSEATFLVFSLHGMRAQQGVPTILNPLLSTLGFAAARSWRARPWPERARHAFVAGKRLAPAAVKRLFHHLAPRSVTQRVDHQSLQVDYDWSRTVAFPLPTDQHGWIRLNLAGRESQGALQPEQYPEVCARLDRLLRGLRTADGRRVVREVRCIAGDGDGRPPRTLPDLVVHWEDAAEAAPLRLASPAVQAYPIGTKVSGHHAPVGFFIWRGPFGSPAAPEAVAAEDLHRLLYGALRGQPTG